MTLRVIKGLLDKGSFGWLPCWTLSPASSVSSSQVCDPAPKWTALRNHTEVWPLTPISICMPKHIYIHKIYTKESLWDESGQETCGSCRQLHRFIWSWWLGSQKDIALDIFHIPVTKGPHKSDFGSQFVETLSIRTEKVGQQGYEAASHTAPTTRSRGVSGVQLTFSFLLSLKSQPLGRCHPLLVLVFKL